MGFRPSDDCGDCFPKLADLRGAVPVDFGTRLSANKRSRDSGRDAADALKQHRTIDGPRGNEINLAPRDGLQQRIKAGTLVTAIGSTDAMILKRLDDRPALALRSTPPT
jgi:hypothetical protein